jgi:hypothetical protein
MWNYEIEIEIEIGIGIRNFCVMTRYDQLKFLKLWKYMKQRRIEMNYKYLSLKE